MVTTELKNKIDRVWDARLASLGSQSAHGRAMLSGPDDLHIYVSQSEALRGEL